MLQRAEQTALRSISTARRGTLDRCSAAANTRQAAPGAASVDGASADAPRRRQQGQPSIRRPGKGGHRQMRRNCTAFHQEGPGFGVAIDKHCSNERVEPRPPMYPM